MKILFISREGVDLYEALENSETSRIIFRFYHPERHPCGVLIDTSSLGTGLSLVSELRWYVRRYMADVLFEVKEGVFGTYALAREVYERDLQLDGAGVRHLFYGIREGKIFKIVSKGPGAEAEIPDELRTMDSVLEVWAPENENGLPAFSEEEASLGDPGENHLNEGL